jgi:ribosomal protein L11 methyltransferase
MAFGCERNSGVYLWQKNVMPRWLASREETLQDRFGAMLSIISKPERKRVEIQIACRSKAETNALIIEFGGRAEKLSSDWLDRFALGQNAKPLKFGRRLVIARKSDFRIASAGEPSFLVIPAGAAFGTGEHATTALSLHLLEELTRGWRAGWSLVDLGTGSGILALAAKRLGAGNVLGIDNDPLAISTAKYNAQTNRLRGIRFQLCNVHCWKSPQKVDVLTANLFSELLIGLLPRLRVVDRLIVSGILRKQEGEVVRALQRNRIDLVKIRRRGKWAAILARNIR